MSRHKVVIWCPICLLFSSYSLCCSVCIVRTSNIVFFVIFCTALSSINILFIILITFYKLISKWWYNTSSYHWLPGRCQSSNPFWYHSNGLYFVGRAHGYGRLWPCHILFYPSTRRCVWCWYLDNCHLHIYRWCRKLCNVFFCRYFNLPWYVLILPHIALLTHSP